MSQLPCVSSVEIKAEKSRNYIIDKAGMRRGHDASTTHEWMKTWSALWCTADGSIGSWT
jgi:hypothetical protein